jgi:hypothetical protein
MERINIMFRNLILPVGLQDTRVYPKYSGHAVKIIKFTIRLIGRHHPRCSSLPHVDTGPTVPIFGTLPGSPLLSMSSILCDSAWISSVVSNRGPFRFNLIFGHRKNSQGAKSGEYGGWGDDSHFVFHQKLLGGDGSARRDVVMLKQPGLFSPEFGVTSSHISRNRRKSLSRTRNSQFGLWVPVLRATTTAV